MIWYVQTDIAPDYSRFMLPDDFVTMDDNAMNFVHMSTIYLPPRLHPWKSPVSTKRNISECSN